MCISLTLTIMPRGVAVPLALAATVIHMKADSISPKKIQKLTEVSEKQWKQILDCCIKTGEVPKPKTLWGRKWQLTKEEIMVRALNVYHIDILCSWTSQFLQGCINDECDSYLDELQESLQNICGKTASQVMVWRALQRAGYHIKRVCKGHICLSCLMLLQLIWAAIEHSIIKRAQYIQTITQYNSQQLVFVDKSATDRHTTYHGFAWAFQGWHAVQKAFFVQGWRYSRFLCFPYPWHIFTSRYSILLALSLDGILTVDIVEGSFNKVHFAHFIDGLLGVMNLYPLPNSVIVMDNCRIHKCPKILDMIMVRGMWYKFLPPYSPDFSPIELAFSAIKAHIHRNGGILWAAMSEEDDSDVYALFNKAIWSVIGRYPELVWTLWL